MCACGGMVTVRILTAKFDANIIKFYSRQLALIITHNHWFIILLHIHCTQHV